MERARTHPVTHTHTALKWRAEATEQSQRDNTQAPTLSLPLYTAWPRIGAPHPHRHTGYGARGTQHHGRLYYTEYSKFAFPPARARGRVI